MRELHLSASKQGNKFKALTFAYTLRQTENTQVFCNLAKLEIKFKWKINLCKQQ